MGDDIGEAARERVREMVEEVRTNDTVRDERVRHGVVQCQ